jgi:hypothetical protein
LGYVISFITQFQLLILREQPAVPFDDEESGSFLMPHAPLVFYGCATNPQSVSPEFNVGVEK